jgi:uroporphyrinogen decarboxylase
MTGKQNAYEIISFGKPEKIVPHIPSYIISYVGANHQGYDEGSMKNGHDRPVGSRWYDIWGTMWHKEYPNVMGFPEGNPLAKIEDLAEYSWPDPDDERICGRIYQQAADFTSKDEEFLLANHNNTLWEKSYMLVGMENMMEYFYNEPQYAKEILERIMDFQMGIAQHYIKAGVEMAGFGDDLGTQHSLLLSPDIVREYLVPEYRRLFNFYKSHNVLIDFHTCGHIEPLIDIFMELGVDVINPVQVTANNLQNIRKKTQDCMALKGGISSELIINGPIDELKTTIKETMQLLGKDGGYFCSPDQWMPFPQEHIDAFDKAVHKYGRYPL